MLLYCSLPLNNKKLSYCWETVRRDSMPILIDIGNFFNNDVIMSSLFKKLSISVKIHVVRQIWSLFVQFPNCRPNPSLVVVS